MNWKEKIQKLPYKKYLKNRYVVVALIFLFWLSFFDQNNLLKQGKLMLQLRKAKSKTSYYQAEVKKVKKDLNLLVHDPETLEKFAREKHKMKKENEEIFLID